MYISKDIKYIGVNDHSIDLFEGQYDVPLGMSYNSYLIADEKIAVTDTVDADFKDEWFSNLNDALDGRMPDYLIVHHMEPDHSALIGDFARKYPGAVIVSSAKAFGMMKNFIGIDFSERRIVVSDGDTLLLGRHELTFITAPMVHWPEVIMSYDKTDKILFSADAFGKFGALDIEDEWDCEARRYYFGIVGKYGAQVQSLLKKAGALDIKAICPLHGPVLTEDIPRYISLYDTWSSYRPENSGVLIAYTSVYGNTGRAAEYLADRLKELGCENVVLTDLARSDMAEAIEDAFRYDRLVLATTTYNADIFPYMRQFIDGLTERGYKNRTVGFIENGSWAPTAEKVMRAMLERSENIKFTENNVRIMSALSKSSLSAADALAKELMALA